MPESSKKQKTRVVSGVLLILVGVLVAFGLIGYQYYDCANRWLNNLDGFAYKYASIWDCFMTRCDVTSIIALLVGTVPVCLGCFLCKKR